MTKKNLDLESGIKKIMKWVIYKTHMRNYEGILRTRNLKRGMVS